MSTSKYLPTNLTTNNLYPQNMVNQYKNMHKIFKSDLFSARRAPFDLHSVAWAYEASTVFLNSLTQTPATKPKAKKQTIWESLNHN